MVLLKKTDMNTNILEICHIQVLEWSCYTSDANESTTEDIIISSFSSLTSKGYLCAMDKTCDVLWLFCLNKQHKMPDIVTGLKERSKGRWKPENQIILSDCDVLLYLGNALQLLLKTVMLQNNFIMVENCFVPLIDDEKQFYRIPNHDKLCVYVVTLGRQLNSSSLSREVLRFQEFMVMDVTKDMFQSFLGLDEWSLWLYKFEVLQKENEKQLVSRELTLLTDVTVGTIQEEDQEDEMHSLNSIESTCVPVFARKRPRTSKISAIQVENRLKSNNSDEQLVVASIEKDYQGNPICSPRYAEDSSQILCETQKVVLEQNPVLLYLEKLAEDGLKVASEDPNLHLQSRYVCPQEYLAKPLKIQDSRAILEKFKNDISLRKIAPSRISSHLSSYFPKLERKKYHLLDESAQKNKLEIHFEQRCSQVVLPSKEDLKTFSELSIEDLHWASILLRKDALVGWCQLDPLWNPHQSRNKIYSRIASTGEKQVALYRVLPVLDTIRKWLKGNNEKESIRHSWITFNAWSNKQQAKPLDQEVTFVPLPHFSVSHYEDWLRIPPQRIASWEYAQFRPIIEAKNVEYVVLCPETNNEHLIKLATMFMKNITATYQSCGLGSHKPTKLVAVNGLRDSVKIVDSEAIILLPQPERRSDLVAPYRRTCRRLKRFLAAGLKPHTPFSDPPAGIIVYVISPFMDPDNVDLCRLLSALACGTWGSDEEDADKIGVIPLEVDERVVFEIIRLEQLFGVQSVISSLRETSFSVFNKLKISKELDSSRRSPKSSRSSETGKSTSCFVFEPLYALAGKENLSEEILHGCYLWTQSKAWLISTWTDIRGEIFHVETLHVDKMKSSSLKEQLGMLWSIAQKLSHLLGNIKHIVLTKCGSMKDDEAFEWDQLLTTTESLDVDSSIVNISLVSLVADNSLQLIPEGQLKDSKNTFKERFEESETDKMANRQLDQEKDQDKSIDRERDILNEVDRDKLKERNFVNKRDTDRENEQNRERIREQDRERDDSRDRDKGLSRDIDREREKNRDRERESDQENDRNRYKERARNIQKDAVKSIHSPNDEFASFTCIPNSYRYNLEEEGLQTISYQHPCGYLITKQERYTSSSVGFSRKVLLGDVPAYCDAVTLQIFIRAQYRIDHLKSEGDLVSCVKKKENNSFKRFIQEILEQFHDLSFLTMNPITLQRQSPYPVHIASAITLATRLADTKKIRADEV